MPCWGPDAFWGAWCLVKGTLSAFRQHQVGEREADVETEGEAVDARQRGRGRRGGSKAGVRVLGSKREKNQAYAWGGGREMRKGRAPPTQDASKAHCQMHGITWLWACGYHDQTVNCGPAGVMTRLCIVGLQVSWPNG